MRLCRKCIHLAYVDYKRGHSLNSTPKQPYSNCAPIQSPHFWYAILNDAATNSYIAGSAFHLYAGDISALTQVHNAFPDKGLYFTEQWTSGTGLRSIVAMDWNKQTNALFALQHGRDDLHLLWPQFYSAWDNAVTPAEEFFEINENSNYGWPYSYYDALTKQKLQAPEYGGDGKKLAIDQTYTNPLATFPAHWAPNDLLFYTGDQFPNRYKNGAFIAFHGSTNRGPYPQAGYIVAFVPFENGKPAGEWEVFADGFAGVDTIVNVSDAKYRPMGLAEGPDGSLYINDSKKGKIWRILYKEDRSKFTASALTKMEQRKVSANNIKTPDALKDIIQIKYSKIGAQIYQTYCTNCHQSNLNGDGNRNPSLIKSNYLNDKSSFRSLISNGKGNMPAFKNISDKEINELETYLQSVINKK